MTFFSKLRRPANSHDMSQILNRSLRCH